VGTLGVNGWDGYGSVAETMGGSAPAFQGMATQLQSDRTTHSGAGVPRELPVTGKRSGLQIVVGRGESREYILTNKETAYFAGETGTTTTRSYAGLIVDLHKYLEGWDLLLGDSPVTSWGVRNACVLPQSMTREYIVERTIETVFLADGENLLIVSFSSNYRGKAAFLPRFDIRSIWEEGRPEYETCWDASRQVFALRRTDHAERTGDEDYPVWVAIACDRPIRFAPKPRYLETTYTKDAARRAMGTAVPYTPGRLEFEFAGEEQFAAGVTFAIGVGDTFEEAAELAGRGIDQEFAFYDAKMRRISGLLESVGVAAHDRDYRYALQWAAASLDALVMNQLGRGIFAGLHWFPNYWGRDTFISLPGTCLVRGDFETAREILETFAGMQNRDADAREYGRIPNLAMPGETYYNTADGTWWFVREAYEYVRYTGDIDFAGRIFPAIELAIEGAFAKRVAGDFLLMHGRAETWMDAGGEGHPFSPRADRAVEVEALWYTALVSGGRLAAALGFGDRASRWAGIAESVRDAFGARFWNADRGSLYDHIDPDDVPDTKRRPNSAFALTVPWDDLVPPERQGAVLEDLLVTCVLPHGVTSLDPNDPDFHARHLDLDRYHFDEAYHNGDVWVWLAGPVVTALVRHGLVGRAWEQTRVLRDLMFEEGAAGTLPELRNGVAPESGDNVAGAVSQAWSLAEFLRNFYQDYLGVHPDLLEGTVTLAPALPPGLQWIAAPIHLGEGTLSFLYKVDPTDGVGVCEVHADDNLPELRVLFAARVPPGRDVQSGTARGTATLSPGGVLRFTVSRRRDEWVVDVAHPRSPGTEE